MRCELADRNQPDHLVRHGHSKSTVIPSVIMFNDWSIRANVVASEVASNISSSVLVGFPHDLRIYDHRPPEGDVLVRSIFSNSDSR
jgi:hypothetical protein